MRPVSILLIAALGFLGLAGCTGDDDSAAEFCQLLGELPTDSPWREVDLMIHVDPAADERVVEALRKSVDEHGAVASHDWISQQEAYEDFAEMFADSPEMMDAVSPEILPPVILVTLNEGVDDPTELGFDDRPGVYRVTNSRHEEMTVVDWSIRPLTTEMGPWLSAFTVGRTDIDLASKAPNRLRDHAEAIEALWAAPFTTSDEVREKAMEGARQVVAYYDTECE